MATPNLTGITSVLPGILASGQVAAAATDTTVFTVAANKAAKLATLVLTNTSVSPVTVSVSVVPSGGTVDGTHRVLSAYSLTAGDATALTEVVGAWLGQGDLVSINASAGAAINYLLTGLVFS